MSGGGGGGGVPSRFSRTHLPRCTTEVRFGIGGHGEDAALAQQAAAIRIGQSHAAELRAVDVRDAVVLGQALVQISEVGARAVR